MVYKDMKTQELTHVHALLFEIREYLVREGSVQPEAFADYDAQPVRPYYVHRGKAAHREAIELLLEGFDRGVRADSPTPIKVR